MTTMKPTSRRFTPDQKARIFAAVMVAILLVLACTTQAANEGVRALYHYTYPYAR